MRNIDSDLFVVGIGASAGGLDALQLLFDNTPEDTGMAFIIIQHLSPDFVSLMPELLGKHTNMKIFTAADKQTIEANCIYLNQRNKNLHIKGRELYLLDKGPKHNLNLPIDIFFHTLGEEFKENSIGVVLSGTGSDGSRGIKTIKEAGGVVMVQEPTSAQFDGMPNSAIATNQIDFVLTPENIGETFTKLPRNIISLPTDEVGLETNETIVNSILTEVYKYSNIDFREYKKNTLLRRLEKRLGINNIEHLYDYYTFLKSNKDEQEALKQDFLIGVTRFFRDTEAFQILENKIIPAICKDKKPSDTIRIWTSGCSTGEEVYSIAILFDSYIRAKKLNLDFKIFATDVDSTAIASASIGSFHINTIVEMNAEFAERYFIKTGDKIQIIKRIREKIVFSNHNIFVDPPFINLDLITCRNLLIYLENKIQQKILKRFHFGLKKFGYMFLGNSETLGEKSKHFKTIDTKWKIYQHISDGKDYRSEIEEEHRIDTINFSSPNKISRFRKKYEFKDNPEILFQKYLIQKFGPDCIIIDKDFGILFISGDAGKRLTHNTGSFQNNLLKIINTKTAAVIRNGIRKLERENKDIIIKDVVVKQDEAAYTFDICLHKPQNEDNLNSTYILQFSKNTEIELQNALVIKDLPLDEISKQHYEDLENELKSTKEELQNVVEELETTNEELQSSNEELMASNEELQSTNEELQSVNEELYTVNTELQEKNKELNLLNNDITNLLDSTDIATLFLDSNLRIRKFTPQLQTLFHLEESDYGRPIASFASSFNEVTRESMLSDAKKVISKLSKVTREVEDLDGNFYLISILPFITSDKVIDGVVFTFVNINEIKENEKALLLSETHLKKAQEIAKVGSWYLDLKTGMPTWTDELYKMYGFDPKKPLPPYTEHAKLFTEESWATLSVALEKATGEGVPYSLELKTIKKDKTNGWMWVSAEALKNDNGEVYALWGAAQDISERRLLSENVKLNEEKYRQLFEYSPDSVIVHDLDMNIIDVNEKAIAEFGYTKAEFIKKKVFDLNPEKEKTNSKNILKKIKKEGSLITETVFLKKDGSQFQAEATQSKYRIEGNEFVQVLIRNITTQKKNQLELIKAKEKAEEADRLKSAFLANMSHEIRTPMNGILGFTSLLEQKGVTGEDKKRFVEIIKKSGGRMLDTVNDLIDISKVETGQVEIHNKEFNICKEIKNYFSFFKPEANKKGLELTLNNKIPECHQNIKSDLQKINSIFNNLIKNAIKFTDSGSIEIGINKTNEILECYVKDTGIGIPKNRQKEVFSRFVQADIADTRAHEGSGLGLAITKAYIELLGGKIWLESKQNVGSTFYFNIPFKNTNVPVTEVKNKKPIPLENITKKQIKILVAEDDEVSFTHLTYVLQDFAKEIIRAKTGFEAVEICKNNSDIDIILMDIKMPMLNGFEATKKIRDFNKQVIIVAQTAYALAEDKEKTLKAGCNDYVSKPINKETLHKVVNKWIN